MSIREALAATGKITQAFAKDDPVDKVVQGIILSADLRQVVNYEDGVTLEWWDKDETQPKQHVVIVAQTELRDPNIEGDDGRRAFYIKWWAEQRKELARAVKAAGDDDTRVGGKFAARKAGTVPSDNPKLNDAIVWQYKYERPATGIDFSQISGAPEQLNTQTGELTPQQGIDNFANGLGATPVAPAAQQAQQGWNTGAPAPAATPPAAAPQQAAQPAAPPAAAVPAIDVQGVQKFLSLGMTDQQVAGALGIPEATVAAIRNAM